MQNAPDYCIRPAPKRNTLFSNFICLLSCGFQIRGPFACCAQYHQLPGSAERLDDKTAVYAGIPLEIMRNRARRDVFDPKTRLNERRFIDLETTQVA